jgi:hypothetical protein
MSLGDGFEARNSLGIVAVAVGMAITRQLPISAADLLLRGCGGHTQNLIGIGVRHR